MSNLSQKQVDEVIGVINIKHGTNYRFLSRFDKGADGAYRIAEPRRKVVVLKFLSDLQSSNIVDADPELSKKITDRLLSLGYLLPKYIHTGTLGAKGLYWVQEELPGKPLWQNPTVGQIEQLLSLLELQRNQAISIKQNWSSFVKDTVFGDKTKKANLLKKYSKETDRFLNNMMLSVKGLEKLSLPREDVVHGDFSYQNAMIENGKIVGIIDWQEAGCGNWLIDLTRLIYSLHDRPVLATPIMKKIRGQDLSRIKIYTVFAALDMVSWQIEHNRAGVEIDKAFNKAKSAFNFVFVKNCAY